MKTRGLEISMRRWGDRGEVGRWKLGGEEDGDDEEGAGLCWAGVMRIEEEGGDSQWTG